MPRTRRGSSVAVVLALALLAAGCGGDDPGSQNGSAGGTPRPGGSIVDLQNFAAGDPTHIDPALASDVQSAQIADLLFDGLTATDSTGEVKAAVAESFQSNADATQWTFNLRDDVRYSNGDPVVPSDFKAAWERVLRPSLASEVTSRFQLIQGAAEVTDQAPSLGGVTADDGARTLTVNLTEPYRDFPALVSLPAFSPVPKSVNAGADWESGLMVGNGPFVMSEPWNRGQYIKLARNESYFGGVNDHRAYLDTLEFRISRDVGSAFRDFEGGNAQVARIPAGQYADVKALRADDVVDTPLMGTEYWGFSMTDPSVGGAGNLLLRQAIALAIDRNDINTKVYGGSRQVASQFSTPSTPGSDAQTNRFQRDVGRARELLREWGGQPPVIRISFNAGAGHDEKASIIQQNLAEIGITATPDPLEGPAYRQALRAGTLQFFRFSWVADYVSYDNMIAPSFSSATVGQDNVVRYSNGEVNRLIAEGRGEADESERASKYRDAESRVMADQAVVPIVWVTAGLVKAPNVRNLLVSPLGSVDYGEAWIA